MSDAADLADFTRRAQAFAQVHVGHDTTRFASNLHSRVELLTAGALALPVTVDDGDTGNAWVCSPRTTYADCATEEALRTLPPVLGRPLAWLGARTASWLSAAGIDRVAALNNWLLSTNLYPPLAATPLADVLAQARERWPTHALWWRSLNDVDNADWIAALERAGFQRVASRQVYLFDDWPALARRHGNLKADLKLLARTDLARTGDTGLVDADYARIAELYTLLYLDKYSRHNPRYTPALMRAWHHAGLLEFDALRDAEGRLQSVVGLFRQGRTLTAPIVGYDTARPMAWALYRRLTASACATAMARGQRLNFSAGAAQFKRLRGGRPAMEYSLVCTRHLPRRTRRAVATLGRLTRGIAVPLMRRYGL
jgi:hypothetical protein